MVFKRPFGSDESYEYPWKHPRQLDCSNQLSSFEVITGNDLAPKYHVPGYESEGGLNKCQYADRLVSEKVVTNKDFENRGPSSFSWVNRSTREEDIMSEAAIRLSFFPGIFEHDHPIRPRVDDEEMISSTFDRRPVSIGPDHQADIPVWCGRSMCTDLGSADAADSGSSQASDHDYCEKMMGTCIIPMPDSEVSDSVGKGRTDCGCQDEGSMRCVRQHIMEAREKLLGTLGQDTFASLGFFDMGEEVSTKWSEKEEQIFSEVVFSNPASLGKNFWAHLSAVFPSRTKKEIVSYYFNVFVLRRRAEQNRFDPLHIDSDDDEWQCSEDHETSDDEDSVIESPENCDYPLHMRHFNKDDEFGADESHDNKLWNNGSVSMVVSPDDLDSSLNRNRFNEEGESGNHENYDNDVDNAEGAARCADNVNLPGNRSLSPALPHNSEEDHDVQDDSCTSYECHLSRADSSNPSIAPEKGECRIENDHSRHFLNSFDVMSGMSNNLGYDMEPCDTKVWDVRFLSSCKTDVDLLPTCNMIEEVFGDEAWNKK